MHARLRGLGRPSRLRGKCHSRYRPSGEIGSYKVRYTVYKPQMDRHGLHKGIESKRPTDRRPPNSSQYR